MTINKKRYHIDNTFFTSPLKFGCFELYQLCDLACSSDYKVPEHTQVCHEITYIVSGKAVFGRNGKAFHVSAGKLFINRINDRHFIESSKTDPVRFVNFAFRFDKEHPDYEKFIPVENFFLSIKDPVAEDLYCIFNTFSMLIAEFSHHSSLGEMVLESYFTQILAYTYRSFMMEKQRAYYSADKNGAHPIVYEIISYIDTNIGSGAELSYLSRYLGYSYGYLSKVFSETMGINIRQYYSKKRFEKACELLRSGCTQRTVSEKLGFADPQTFSKAFKKYYGFTAGEYLSQNHDAASS